MTEYAAQAYIGNYTSHTKIDRLVFIAEKSAGKPLELEALKIAADELKQVCRHQGWLLVEIHTLKPSRLKCSALYKHCAIAGLCMITQGLQLRMCWSLPTDTQGDFQRS